MIPKGIIGNKVIQVGMNRWENESGATMILHFEFIIFNNDIFSIYIFSSKYNAHVKCVSHSLCHRIAEN